MTRIRLSIILIFALLFFLVVGLLSGTVFAQDTPGSAIDWFVMAGGGGSSSGANITLESTLGQSITGSSEGGNVSLSAGFWYAEDPPALYLPMLHKK
jgi:hypothetical protein